MSSEGAPGLRAGELLPLERSVLHLTIKLQEPWKATVAATEEQQSAVGSLAKVVLQTRRALNVITAEAGVSVPS